MKVILLEDIDRLGRRGTVHNVADGYGRNFLIPRKLAMPASDANLKQIEMQSKKLKAVEQKAEKDAGTIKQEIEQLSLNIPMKAGDGDVLFGSVTSADIAEELEKKGYSIDKRKIELEEPIKRLGDYQVPLKLHKTVTANVKLSVVKES